MDADGGVATRSFRSGDGTAEHILVVTAPAGRSFPDQIKALQSRYEVGLAELGLPPGSAVFRRIFLSDVMNQAALVRNGPLAGNDPDDPVAVSIVQQAPLDGGKIALLAYHLEDTAPPVKHRLSPKHILLDRGGLKHLWSTRLCAGDEERQASSAAQTRQVFYDLMGVLAAEGGTLAENCVRTWLYIKSIDIFYQGMVDSRRALFAAQGLTGDTHFISSTGIEGGCSHRYDLVAMDAYSILGLMPGQMSFLNDFDMLCATKDYNVTFERGTRIGYRDRAHHFISGTASIDTQGMILYPGDVLMQLERAVQNVEALLRSGQAGLSDLLYLIVYLRDPADAARVGAALDERLPGLPRVMVEGAVCRPEWLIEIEGIAAAADRRPDLPAF